MNFYSQKSIRLLPKPTLKQKIINFLKYVIFRCSDCKKLKFSFRKYELYRPRSYDSYKRVCKKCYNDVPF